MALIACPECKREISDKAAVCPGCGVVIAGQTGAVVVKEQFLNRNRGCLESLFWLFLIGIILSAVVGVFSR